MTGSILGLTALLAACRESDDDAPRFCATMPMGGRILLEYQAYLARGAGADGFVVYAERITGDIRQAVDRLHQAGFRVKLAQSVPEMIDHIHPADRLLVIADGMVASADIIERMVSYPGDVIGTIADIPAHAAFERLDGRARWSGIAMVQGNRIGAIRSMPEDWDVQSTLLRSVIQSGIVQLEIDDMIAPAGDAVLHQVEDGDALADVDQQLLNQHQADPGHGDWIEQHVFGRMGQTVGPTLLRYGIAGTWLTVAALLFQCIAVGFFSEARPGLALLSLLVAGPVHALAQMLGMVRGERNPLFRHRLTSRRILDALAILALGWGLYQAGAGWGQLILCLVAVQHALYLRFFVIDAPGTSLLRAVMRPGGDMLAWLMVPFALLGLWHWVPAVLACWLIAVFVDQRRSEILRR